MADRIEQFTVTAPAGTLKTAPLEVATRFNPGELEEIEIVVPDGHAGLTGIALALAHSRLVPETADSFITSNDEIIRWPVSNFPNSGAWSAYVYNLDTFSHTWYVRFLVRELGSSIHLVEPTAPGESVGIVVGSGSVGDGSDLSGGVIDVGGPPDTAPPPDDAPPPDLTPPADDTSGDVPLEPVDDLTPPADDSTAPVDVVPDLEPPPEDVAPAPAPPPPPAPIVIPTYGLPADYTAGAIPIFGNPGNLGRLIGTVLGYKLVSSGQTAGGAYNTWRFFSDLGNTMDWNFYYSGAKAMQWVGPFTERDHVPAG